YKAAGDPAKYPEQVREGLRPWKPKKFYYTGGRGAIGGRGGPGGPGGRGGRGGPPSQQSSQPATAGQPAATPPSAAPQPAGHVARVNTGAYDALLGRTYAEIGSDAHSNHKCQGTGGLPGIPGVQQGGRGGGGQGGAAYALQ